MTQELSIRSSSVPQFELCPGAYAACKGITSPDNPASLEGTQCHMAMEAYYLGVEFDESRLTDSGSMLTRWFKKEMDGLIESHDGAKKVITELEMSHPIPGSKIKLTGHVDLLVLCNDGTALVVDWKFGRLEVTPAPKNSQLMAYTWLFSKASEGNSELAHTHIDAFIFSAGSDKAFTGVRYKKESIAGIGSYLSSIATDATDPEAKRIPTEPACRYCQASGTDTCHESKEWVEQAAVGMELMKTVDAQLPADSLEVVRIFKAIKQVDSFGTKFLARLKAEVIADPDKWQQHFKVQPGNKTRSITDVQGVYDAIVTGADLVPAEALLNTVELSIGKLEKLLKEPLKENGIKAGKQKDYIAELLGDLIETDQNAPSIKLVN